QGLAQAPIGSRGASCGQLSFLCHQEVLFPGGDPIIVLALIIGVSRPEGEGLNYWCYIVFVASGRVSLSVAADDYPEVAPFGSRLHSKGSSTVGGRPERSP